jgi:hypothetical protein
MKVKANDLKLLAHAISNLMAAHHAGFDRLGNDSDMDEQVIERKEQLANLLVRMFGDADEPKETKPS